MRNYPFRASADAGGALRVYSSERASSLLEAKVLAPGLPAAHVSRRSLMQHLDGMLQRRLTVLGAPAGFGKTTALAEAVHERRKDGVIVGWMSLDAEDTPGLFGSYLACSLQRAGLELGALGALDVGVSSDEAVHRVGMLAHAIERHEAPCLLVLDEVDNLPSPTVQLVDRLLQPAARNLHVALAFRTDPGIDLSGHIRDGEALVLGAEALRFSTADIDRFFGGALSQKELAAMEERTAGWPVALMVHRNTADPEVGLPSSDAAQLIGDYIAMRLLRDLSPEDRDSLFDLAVFDRIDADLVDEVLGSSDARLRVVSLSPLEGLLPGVGAEETGRRLHPLLRDYCLSRLAARNPDRKRFLHRRIARELVRRGRLAAAWRQAGAAGDSGLLGELIERYGACRLWLREGVTRLVSAGRFLSPRIMERYPRLDLLQCIMLSRSSTHDEAAARFEAVSKRTDGFARDRDGGDPEALAVDAMFTRSAMLRSFRQLQPGDFASWDPAEGDPAAVVDERVRALACARHTLLCLASYERASFEESRRHGLRAHAYSSEDTRFGEVVVDTCLGMAAMAQGRAKEARTRYRRARRVATGFLSSDPSITASTDVLTIELDLEENRERAGRQGRLTNPAGLQNIWTEIDAVAVGVKAELMLGQYDHDAVVEHLSKAADEARATGVEHLSNHMSALLAYCLVEVGRSAEAGRVWRDEGLPCGAAEVLDLERRPWRVMEALACARIRLLGESSGYDAARELARGLCAVALERGLIRTLLRGLALSMVVAHRARRRDRAVEHLADFLRAGRGVNYTRPLARHRAVSRRVLRRLLATDPDEGLRAQAESMLASLEEPSTGEASPDER